MATLSEAVDDCDYYVNKMFQTDLIEMSDYASFNTVRRKINIGLKILPLRLKVNWLTVIHIMQFGIKIVICTCFIVQSSINKKKTSAYKTLFYILFPIRT